MTFTDVLELSLPYDNFQVSSAAMPLTTFLHRLEIHFNKIRYYKSTNYPYLSGDTFASIVDYAVPKLGSPRAIEVKRLQDARSIFVYGEDLDTFLEKFWFHLNARVLITGNADRNYDFIPNLPESVKLWLCQNIAVPNSVLTRLLPIGLENIALGKSGLPRRLSLKDKARELKVLIPPMSPTNPIRKQILNYDFVEDDDFIVKQEYVSPRQYFRMINEFQFVLCLEGNGYDTHRIWECLYLNIFPVVLETPWSLNLDYLNLPILKIRDLREINHELLSSFYEENISFDSRNTEVLWIDYWKKLISNYA